MSNFKTHKVFCISLAKIKSCLARNPSEITGFRKSAAKYALLRAVHKIAHEIKARRTRNLSGNDYVNSLLCKFDGVPDAPRVDPDLLVYNPG
jgi:hypothetical protein